MHKDVGKRVMALLLSICMIAGMVDWSGFTVRAAEEEVFLESVEIKENAKQHEFTGNPIELTDADITVTDSEGNVVQREGNGEVNFEIECNNNINVSDYAEVHVIGKGKYENSVLDIQYFKIVPKTIQDTGFSIVVTCDKVSAMGIVDDSKIHIDVKDTNRNNYSMAGVKKGGNYNGADYYFEVRNHNVTSLEQDAAEEIVITGCGNYQGNVEKKFTIPVMNPSEFKIEPKQTSAGDRAVEINYSNLIKSDIKTCLSSKVKVTYKGRELSEADYKLVPDKEYRGSTTEAKVHAEGQGEYAGLTSADFKFTIKKNISSNSNNTYPETGKINITIPTQKYPGKGNKIVIDPKVVEFEDLDGEEPIIFPDSQNSGQKSDWEFKDDFTYIKQDETRARITITGQGTNTTGRYTGTRAVEFDVEAAELTDKMVSVDDADFVFDGTTNWAEKAKEKVIVSDGTNVYTKDIDYTVESVVPANAVDARDKEAVNAYTIKVKAKQGGAFKKGEGTAKYGVKRLDINGTEVESNMPADYPTGAGGYEYKGGAYEPNPVVKYTDGKGQKQTMEGAKVGGRDYTLEYINNTDAGTATIKIHGQGNFRGTREQTFNIRPRNIRNAEVELVKTEYKYTGYQIEPVLNVRMSKIDGLSQEKVSLTKESDYTITFESGGTDVGTARLRIEGKENYTGTVVPQPEVEVIPFSLKDPYMRLEHINTEVEYTGNAVTAQDLEIRLKRADTGIGLTEADYTVTITGYSLIDATPSGKKLKASIEGKGNYTDFIEREFTIGQCDLGKLADSGKLSIKSGNDAPGSTQYDFLNVSEEPSERYYAYNDGEKVEPEFVIQRIDNSIALSQGSEWTVTYDKNSKIGDAAYADIKGEGNYKGTKRVFFWIKGDFKRDDQYEIEPIEEIYNAGHIDPKNVKIRFGKRGEEQYPVLGTDFAIVNNDTSTPTNVGAYTATLTGQGKNYFGMVGNVPFSVRAFDLTNDNTEENHYDVVLDKAEQGNEYIYSGFAIKPVPTITHNGTNVTDTEYTLEYYKVTGEGEDEQETLIEKDEDACDVGTYKIKVKAAGANYTGETEVVYYIKPYDFGEHYEGKKVQVDGVSDIVLDDIKGNENYAGDAQIENMDYVVWPNMSVSYIPDDPAYGGENSIPLAGAGQENSVYTVEYDANNTIGLAKIIIRAKEGNQNFTGQFEYPFRIKGDLDNAEIKIDSCIYTPPKNGNETNTPSYTVQYTVTHEGDGKEPEVIKILANSGVFDQEYTENGSATHVDENTPLDPDNPRSGKLKITGVSVDAPNADVEEPKSYIGYFVGEKTAEFKILQRDLHYALEESEEEGYVWDETLKVSGLLDEYEYTGKPIVPDVEITCTGEALDKKEGDSDTDYEYDVTAVNNTNVYEYDEAGNQLQPEVTVSAKMTDGNYMGNYKGSFSKKFTIRPREIRAETITVEGVPEYENFTGNPITFDESQIKVTWSVEQDGVLVSDVLSPEDDYGITYEHNVKIGDGYVVITAKPQSNYAGEYKHKFSIRASIEVVDDPSSNVMTLEYGMDVGYGGENTPVYPKLNFTDYSGPLYEDPSLQPYKLEEGKDFEIVVGSSVGDLGTSKNNINVANYNPEDKENSPTVVVRGIGNYYGAIKKFYNIVPKSLSDESIHVVFTGGSGENGDEFYYTGEAINPSYAVYNGESKMQLGRDYEHVGYADNIEISTEGNLAKLHIKATEGGNYTGTGTFNFKIVPRDFSTMTLTVSSEPQIYDRQEKRPEVTVSYRGENGRDVIVGPENYDVRYEANIDVPVTGGERPKVIVDGKGIYAGRLEAEFDILPESIAEGNEDIVITGNPAFYLGTGEEIKTTFVVQPQNSEPLTEGKDYEVSDYQDNTEIGTGSALIKGIGNYTGERRVSFLIAPADGRLVIEDIPEETYNTKEHRPEVTVHLQNDDGVSLLLKKDRDYEVSYSNNTNAGNATVTVTGKEPFDGKAEKNFKINPKVIGVDGTIESGTGMTIAPIRDYQYTGSDVIAAIDLRFQPSVQDAVRNGKSEDIVRLELNKDYTVAYKNNKAVGQAEATITGIKNYTGTIQTGFKIVANMSMAEVMPIPMQDYTGSPVEPVPIVSLGGKVLEVGSHYTIEYLNNVERGTATIVIKGISPWYLGEKRVNFDIAKQLSEKTAIRGVASVYTYTGSPITPPIRVEEGGALLVKGVDYEASYSQNVDAGTATVVIKGIGKYTGTASTTFQIMPQQLGRAKVSPISDQVYNGKEQNPPITVTSGDKTLQNGKDYSLVYVNSAKPGMASVIIKGEGNYTGTQTVNYRIKVPGMTGVKFSKYTSSSVTISWTKNSVVTGYEIYNAKNRRALRVKKSSTTKGTVKKLKAGTAATFRVRAYVNKDGQYYYGPFTSIKTATAPSATKISSLASKKKKQVVVKWKKVKGATQYEVYRATSKKGKYKKIGTLKKTTYTDKKATGGKKYYYKVRVCKKINKKNYYSSYSAVKSVKAKK